MRRYSGWTVSQPFSLNAVESNWVESVGFSTTKLQVVPVVAEFTPSGEDPTGLRHVNSGSGVAQAFVQIVGSGSGIQSLSFPSFDLNSANIGSGSGITCTHCVVFRIADFECSTTRVSNVKVWHSDFSDFLCPETSTVLFRAFDTWVSGFQFFAREINTESFRLPRSLPNLPNVLRQDGKTTFYQTDDDHVSQFLYFALAASGTTPLGEYGGTQDGNTGFGIRFTYDIDNLPLRD